MSMSGFETKPISGWAVGGVTFAGVLMIIIGFFQGIAGLTALFNDEFFVITQNYTFDLDVTAWGWIHLILGVLIVLTGFALLRGAAWAALVTVVLAALSAISNFFFIPYGQPFWSIIEIGLAIWVIWAVTRPGISEESL
jgi:hypothetical protein